MQIKANQIRKIKPCATETKKCRKWVAYLKCKCRVKTFFKVKTWIFLLLNFSRWCKVVDKKTLKSNNHNTKDRLKKKETYAYRKSSHQIHCCDWAPLIQDCLQVQATCLAWEDALHDENCGRSCDGRRSNWAASCDVLYFDGSETKPVKKEKTGEWVSKKVRH